MDIKKEVLNYIKEDKIIQSQSFILTQLDADRFRSKMMVEYQQDSLLNIDGLFEPDIKTDFIKNNNNWDRDYWTQMRVKLSNNFSKEKLFHVIEVMTFLRKEGHKKFIHKQNNRSLNDNINEVSHSNGKRTEVVNNKGYIEKSIAVGLSTVTGVAIGAVLTKGGIIAASVLKGAAIGGVAGAAIGLTVAYVINSKQEKYNEKYH